MESTGTKIYKWLVRLDIIVAIFFIGTGNFVLGEIIILPLLLILFKGMAGAAWRYFTAPFRYLHAFFTKKLYHNYYKNNFERIVFGWFGNIAYYVFLFFIFAFIFTYRPYQDGYICRDGKYNVGEVVVVKLASKEKAIGTIEDVQAADNWGDIIKVSVNGEIMETDVNFIKSVRESPIICGHYVTENENFFLQVAKSGWGLIKNIIALHDFF